MSPVDSARQPGTSVSVGEESKSLVAANINRREVIICNDHASQVVYLSLGGTAAANKGIRLSPNGGSYRTAEYRGAITAFATGASTTVTVTEV